MAARITVAEALPWVPSSVPYFIQSPDETRLIGDLAAAGFEVRPLEGSSLADERSLVRALGPTLSFPDYYGGNWAAFIDCAGDLAEVADAPFALVWTCAERLARVDLHAFTRGIHLILSTAESLALSDAGFQLELFLVGDWGARTP